jgi:hypothetical protein
MRLTTVSDVSSLPPAFDDSRVFVFDVNSYFSGEVSERRPWAYKRESRPKGFQIGFSLCLNPRRPGDGIAGNQDPRMYRGKYRDQLLFVLRRSMIVGGEPPKVGGDQFENLGGKYRDPLHKSNRI